MSGLQLPCLWVRLYRKWPFAHTKCWGDFSAQTKNMLGVTSHVAVAGDRPRGRCEYCIRRSNMLPAGSVNCFL